MPRKFWISLLFSVLLAAPVLAQQSDTSVEQPTEKIPVYRVTVVGRTAQAVNYRNRSGSTKVDFRGTDLMPLARGDAKVESKTGRFEVDANFEKVQQPTSFGQQYLTYVLWAITPEGRPMNLGEVIVKDSGKADIKVTTDLQAFGLIVTAEPYFAVAWPSNMVVLQNIIRENTKGWEQPISAKFEVLEKGEYTIDVPVGELPATSLINTNVPRELLEARNAVAIARAAGAEKYAPDSFAKAKDFLKRAEDAQMRKGGDRPVGTLARGATESAEDARLITLRTKKQEQVAAKQAAADARAARARAEAAAEAAHAQQAEQAKAVAETEKAVAQEQQAQSQAEAQQAQQAAAQAEHEKEAMRARLLSKLNAVLQTQDSSRGLVVHMSDVLFDTGQATIKKDTREQLAKLSGIIMAYPGLKLTIEGHTDSVGSDEMNMTLSQKRASAVRDFLVSQGLPPTNVDAMGFGKSDPVASNDSAMGRQLNRRVDIVVSGEAIGSEIGSASAPGNPTAQAVPSQRP